MKKVLYYGAALVASLSLLGSAGVANAAANPNSNASDSNKLLCFSGTTDPYGYGGTCTITKGGATLNNADSNVNGDYSGVYIQGSNLIGKNLANVGNLSYNYSGNVTPGPGDLSLNVPVDVNGDGNTDAYLFIDAAYCGGTGGHVDVINDANCGIYYNGSVFYPNWAAVVAAYPGATVTSDLPFIVAERTPSEPSAIWTISNVHLGKAARTTGR